MKILKSASRVTKVKLSRKEWKNIGIKAGWAIGAKADSEIVHLLKKEAQDSTTIDDLYGRFNNSRGEGVRRVHVTFYEVSRQYGGSEEGGWWYDNYDLKETKPFFDVEEAHAFADAVNRDTKSGGLNDEPLSSIRGIENYPDPSGGDPMYDHTDADIPLGWAGAARNYIAIVEETPGQNETKERPRYE